MKSVILLAIFVGMVGCQSNAPQVTYDERLNMTPATKEGLELGGFVLAHAIYKADGDIGEVVVPFSITLAKGERRLYVYEADRLETGVKRGREELLKSQQTVEAWAMAYATVEAVSGKELMTVDIWHRGGFAAQLLQAYKPPTKGAPFQILGEPLILVEKREISDRDHELAVRRGIDSHPQTSAYWSK